MDAYSEEVGTTPVLPVPRRTSPLLLLHPRYPYVVASRPVPRRLCDQVRESVGPLTGIIVFSYKSHLIGRALATGLGVPAVLRQHNREGDYHRSLAASSSGLRRLVLQWEAARVSKDEAELGRASWLRATADISLADAAARRTAGGRNVVFVPPFAFDHTRSRRPMAEAAGRNGSRVLFLGALDVPTNTAGLAWFLDRVWPQVLASAPHAVLDVVGRGPSAQLRRRLETVPGATLHADVASVTPFLDRATLAVNPAVTGSGVNIKLIDYLQAGLPVVSTSLATAGLPLRAGVDLEVADDPRAFAGACVRLLGDQGRRDSLALSGRQHVEELLDPEVNLTRVARALTGS